MRAAQQAGEEAVTQNQRKVMQSCEQADGSVLLDNVFRYLFAST